MVVLGLGFVRLMVVPGLGFVTRLGWGGWRWGLWVRLCVSLVISLGAQRIRYDGAREASVLEPAVLPARPAAVLPAVLPAVGLPAVVRAWARDTYDDGEGRSARDGAGAWFVNVHGATSVRGRAPFPLLKARKLEGMKSGMTICMAAGEAAGEAKGRDIESDFASSWASSRRQVSLRFREEFRKGFDPKLGFKSCSKFGSKFGALVGLADPLLAFFGTIFAA